MDKVRINYTEIRNTVLLKYSKSQTWCFGSAKYWKQLLGIYWKLWFNRGHQWCNPSSHTKHQHMLQGNNVMTSYHKISPLPCPNLSFTKAYMNFQQNTELPWFLVLFSPTTAIFLFPSLGLWAICLQGWEMRAKVAVSKSTSEWMMLHQSHDSNIFLTHTAALHQENKHFPSMKDSSRKCQSSSWSPALILEPLKQQKRI